MIKPTQRSAWISATLIGALVLAFLFWLVEPSSLLRQISSANWLLLCLAVLPLCAEVTFTSLRVQHCVNHKVPFGLALYSNSLYIAWLSVLPARLGEIAGVAVFKQRLNMSIGSAIASVIVQRIYDVLILAGLLIALMSQSLYGGKTGLIIASLVWLVLAVVLFTLPFWLTLGARLLLPLRVHRWPRKFLLILLQARTWYRHQSEPGAIAWLVGTTLGKWVVNLICVVTIFTAISIELDFVLLATVAILMHFLGAIPIQSFGGFGAAEVGLTGILVTMDIPPEQAVAASLLVRTVFLCFALLFFGVCFLLLRPRYIATSAPVVNLDEVNRD